jgi:hypothetical protein
MAFEINPYAVKFTAATTVDLSAAQYKFVNLTTSLTANTPGVAAVSAATDRPVGILQNAPKVRTGEYDEAEITVSGISKVVAGGTIAAGASVGTNASGAAVAVVAGTDTTKFILGTALTGGASGDIITVIVSCGAAARAA